MNREPDISQAALKRAAYCIRRMEAADAKKVAALEAENFAQPWREADFEKAALDKETLYLVAEQAGKIVGCCGVRNISGDGEITNVSVDKSFRGQGIAEQLMQRLLAEGKAMGITAFTLEVRSGNQAAVCLYEKLGFVTEGVRKNFYRNPVEDALIMWMRLR